MRGGRSLKVTYLFDTFQQVTDDAVTNQQDMEMGRIEERESMGIEIEVTAEGLMIDEVGDRESGYEERESVAVESESVELSEFNDDDDGAEAMSEIEDRESPEMEIKDGENAGDKGKPDGAVMTAIDDQDTESGSLDVGTERKRVTEIGNGREEIDGSSDEEIDDCCDKEIDGRNEEMDDEIGGEDGNCGDGICGEVDGEAKARNKGGKGGNGAGGDPDSVDGNKMAREWLVAEECASSDKQVEEKIADINETVGFMKNMDSSASLWKNERARTNTAIIKRCDRD